MADFYLDHNAKQQIADELRARGHTAVTAKSQKRDRASDPENLLTAVRQARIVVTYDREEFRMLHDAWTRWQTTPAHFGILIIRKSGHRSGRRSKSVPFFAATRPFGTSCGSGE